MWSNSFLDHVELNQIDPEPGLKLPVGAVHQIVQLLLCRGDVQVQLPLNFCLNCVYIVKAAAPTPRGKELRKDDIEGVMDHPPCSR